MRDKGFTLIELLLVIAIILTIAALMSPVMFSVRNRALVVSCQSNLRQIHGFLLIYGIGNIDGYIPRTCQDVEARNHENQLRDTLTGIPSLKGLMIVIGEGPAAQKILRCPADNGSYGQDYYPTEHPCWQTFGQSQHVNVEMYANYITDPLVPGYNPDGNGPMFGASGAKTPDYEKTSKFMVLSDMWSHWHNGIPVNGESKDHFINILFYDGHVAGKGFDSSLEARRFLNRDDVKRWWITEPPSE